MNPYPRRPRCTGKKLELMDFTGPSETITDEQVTIAYETANGSTKDAAALLGISRITLWRIRKDRALPQYVARPCIEYEEYHNHVKEILEGTDSEMIKRILICGLKNSTIEKFANIYEVPESLVRVLVARYRLQKHYHPELAKLRQASRYDGRTFRKSSLP